MNIGFDAKRAFLNQTGLGNYSRFIIQGLSTYFPENNYYLYSPSVKHSTAIFPNAMPVDLGKGPFATLKRIMGMESYFSRDDLDIFHGLSNELPFFSKNKKTRQIVSVHDLLFLRYPSFYPLLDRKIYDLKTRYACKKADLVIAISQQTKQDLIAFLKVPASKIKVHYQACHPQFIQEHSKEEVSRVMARYGLMRPYILQIGTLETRKNALLTLKAFVQSGLHASFDLALVGKRTPYCDQLYTFVKENRIADKVHFVHKSSFIDFPHLYQGSSFTVYPSRFEGFGIPVLEAMNCGVPVITSKGGCFSEVGGEAVLYTDPNSVEELSYLMGKMANDESLRAQLVAKGKEQAFGFRPELLITELHTIYSHLI